MRIDEPALARTEMHKGVVIICLLFRKSMHRCASYAVFYYFLLESLGYIFACIECLGLVAVVFVADGELLSGFYLPAQRVALRQVTSALYISPLAGSVFVRRYVIWNPGFISLILSSERLSTACPSICTSL